MTQEEAIDWVEAYTPDFIDASDVIRVDLTAKARNMIDSAAIHNKVFEFDPSTKGNVKIENNGYSIIFKPDKPLKQGKSYRCRLRLDRLCGIDSLADFAFSFHVIKQLAAFEDVKTMTDPNNKNQIAMSGNLIYTSENGDTIFDANSFKCSQSDVQIVVDDPYDDRPRTRRFTVFGIRREEQKSDFTIALKPEIDFGSASCTVTVPPTNTFSLLSAENKDDKKPYFELEFSDPLDLKQEPDGLITIDGIDNLKFEHDNAGSSLRVYYSNPGISDIILRISSDLRNNDGLTLGEEIERRFTQEPTPPAIEFPLAGSIIPDNSNQNFIFRAINLAAVDVEVVKIFSSNVPSRLLEMDIDDTSKLRRHGRLIYRRTVHLDADNKLDLHRWNDFSINLAGLFKKDSGAIYNFRLSFRKAYSLYNRTTPAQFDDAEPLNDADIEEWDRDYPYIWRSTRDYDPAKFDWDQKNNPESDSYYMDSYRMPECNIFVSSLGIIAKKSDDKSVFIAVSDLTTAKPVAGASITAYNYQQQIVGKGITDSRGFVSISTTSRPILIEAAKGKSTSYLRTTTYNTLSVGDFDTEGESMAEGIRTFIYGDRGVWRPGDDIYLTLIAHSPAKSLPSDFPVTMTLTTPQGNVYMQKTLTRGVDGFYSFCIHTDEDVPTGTWKAEFKAGGSVSRHNVLIESIKPNRLKIGIETPPVLKSGISQTIGMSARWLSGPPAIEMPASIKINLSKCPAPFKQYKNYIFENPMLDFNGSEKLIFDAGLDSTGTVSKSLSMPADINSPGMMYATLTATVQEPGGDASITAKTVRYSPFGVYVGVALGSKNYKYNSDIVFPVVVVNENGQRLKSRDIDYKIYKIEKSWWYENNAESLRNYVRSSSARVVDTGSIRVTNGNAKLTFKPGTPSSAAYILILRDSKGGHTTGGTFVVEGNGGLEGDGEESGRALSFRLDKPKYKVGERATVYLPQCNGGRVLLTVESGTGIISKQWVDVSANRETEVKLPVTRSISPNFYLSATLIQPYRNTANDAPLRMFGIENVDATDSNTVLHPVIDMPAELSPGKSFNIKVSERDNKPMSYTIAVVDEGLLDITGFRTPDPWRAMNRRQRLGVKTWDMFDDVIGAYAGRFTNVLSIGGDLALRKAAGKEKRFRPVFRFIGPFTLSKKSASHQIYMPQYVGSVRIMLVAAHNGSFGNCERTVKVTSPLMILPTLPRTLSCGDVAELPVNIFASGNSIGRVNVKVKAQGALNIVGVNSKSIDFKTSGEGLLRFSVKASDSEASMSKVIISASSGSIVVRDTINISVRNPMPAEHKLEQYSLKPGETKNLRWSGIDNAALQISPYPALDIKSISTFFNNYGYCCSEQLSSRLIFLLMSNERLDISERSRIQSEIPGLLRDLLGRQTADGGFAYWPDNTNADEWVSSMAGIVFAEAARRGYDVNKKALDLWRKYQQSRARNYKFNTKTDLMQAFRLYSLVLNGDEPKAAMNRLRECSSLTANAALRLSAAYALCGREDVANKLVEYAKTAHETPTDSSTFGSQLRDMAMQMENYMLVGKDTEALELARHIAKDLNKSYITQELAFACVAFNRFESAYTHGSASYTLAEGEAKPRSYIDKVTQAVYTMPAPGGSLKVSNIGKSDIDLSLSTTRQPSAKENVKESSSGLSVKVSYVDEKGNRLNIDKIDQGKSFIAHVTVSNTTAQTSGHTALTFSIPSGWEVWNDRLFGRTEKDSEYSDIRDDRVNIYFSLCGHSSRTFSIRLRAAYKGSYILPPTLCEDMYDTHLRANSPSSVTKVI